MTSATHTHGPARSIAASFVFVAMLLAALSIWTAIPLSWIWIGSKVSKTQFPSTGPYMVVAAGIVISIIFVAWLISRLSQLYVQITGTNRVESMRPPWLKSMRDSSPSGHATTVVEAVLMGSVILAGMTLTVWFFFIAGSPIPSA